MRQLLYVPILHDQADLGSLGAALTRKTVVLSGERRWATHQETMRKFWETVATYLRSFDPRHLKLYQDGLPVGGKMAQRVVEQAAQQGSQNYQLVLELLKGGAQLQQTEDPALLLREHDNVDRAVREGADSGAQGSAEQYATERDRLLEDRDRFIAKAINETLREGEIGVLFIGVSHRVAHRLAHDISVVLVKDPARMGQYVQELLLGNGPGRLQGLARYLAAPIDGQRVA